MVNIRVRQNTNFVHHETGKHIAFVPNDGNFHSVPDGVIYDAAFWNMLFHNHLSREFTKVQMMATGMLNRHPLGDRPLLEVTGDIPKIPSELKNKIARPIDDQRMQLLIADPRFQPTVEITQINNANARMNELQQLQSAANEQKEGIWMPVETVDAQPEQPVAQAEYPAELLTEEPNMTNPYTDDSAPEQTQTEDTGKSKKGK